MTTTETKTYYITTPIYYVNGLPHVGSALTTLCCDVLTRYQRMRGRKAFFLTGTDENAAKVQEAAQKAGQDTQAFVDSLSEAFRSCWQSLHIEYDAFIRTTEPRHIRVVQEVFRRLQERGYVYKDVYEGWYSVSDETFFRDSDVENGIAKESGKPVQRVQEENYFFRLSAFEKPLLEHIEANPSFLQPDFRRNEVIGFIHEGLRDSCITRSNPGWGIPFPGDESKIIYVWFDALINYLTATGWPDAPDWNEKWPADLHFMGKEIFVRFHSTLWPAMLMALDLPLPRQVYAHGWWTVQGAKGGKTGASLPHPVRFAQLLADRSGAALDLALDAERYILCREMNFGLDTEFSVESCLRRFNTDLANDLGNLLNRTLSMMGKYFGGVVPSVNGQDAEVAALSLLVQDEVLRALGDFRFNMALEAVWKLVGRMNKYIDEKAPWSLAKAANNGDAASGEALALVLYTCLEAIRVSTLLVSPFMPVAAKAIFAQLGLEETVSTQWDDLAWGGLVPGTRLQSPRPVFPRIQELSVDEETLFALGSANPAPGTQTTEGNKAATLISRPLSSDPHTLPLEKKPLSDSISESNVPTPGTAQIPEPSDLTPSGEPMSSLQPTKKLEAPSPGKLVTAQTTAAEPESMIGIEEFMKVQLRVGEVLAADPVPNATKLLRLTVQLGEEDTRTILAGIAEYYKAEELIGRKVVVVANLQPRKMRGIESQGMLLAADMDGRAILLQPDAEVPVGSRVR